ncbi:hypothetical protein OIE66_22125 [Nonomuraea sp. NBC_01738]|uniref:hypothetical protein n=1 Tax=Nonomuraea sp. NBC_01738 TaxID=2976003 RepID=UPI002E119C26|nr:hypothetical protein OIE66_22125 [Nonomuraea sp. NBC_01738]
MLLDSRGAATRTRTVSGGWDCSRLRRDVAAGAWWKAPSGKRYYVAAGSRRVVRLTVSGRRMAGRLVVLKRPSGAAPQVTAVNENGGKVTVLR